MLAAAAAVAVTASPIRAWARSQRCSERCSTSALRLGDVSSLGAELRCACRPLTSEPICQAEVYSSPTTQDRRSCSMTSRRAVALVAAAATAAWASAVGMYGSVQKRRSTSSKIVVPSEPSGRCSKITYTPRSQARPSIRRGSMRRCSSKPSSAPLSDGVTARCAARLASQFNEPFANCVRAASTVKTLSGRKDHSKAVPAWASVTLSVRSAKAGIPAGPARHCAAPGGIGASGSMVGFTDVCALLYGCNTVLARRLAPRGHCALRKFLEKLGCKLADRPRPADKARLSKHTLTYHSDSGRESSSAQLQK